MEYDVEPTEMSLYLSYYMMPLMFRIFIGVFIDAQIVSRKGLSVFVNLVTFVLNMGIAFRLFNSPATIIAALVIVNTAHQFLEAVTSTFII